MTQNNDNTAQDKLALRKTPAGMRFIAQMTLYNSGNFDRLHTFIQDSYLPEQLDQQPADSRLQMFRTTFDRVGRMRVKQVLATHEHYVIAAMEVEKTADMFYIELKVKEDYPHHITWYLHSPMTEVKE